MYAWSSDVEEVVRRALDEVTFAESGREHLGRPFITAYQLAIKVRRLDPEVARELEIGGEGAGRHQSLTQFLARELSQRIKRSGGNYFVEGAQLSSVDVTAMKFRHPEGAPSPTATLAQGTTPQCSGFASSVSQDSVEHGVIDGMRGE
jgi:hypothetical protein